MPTISTATINSFSVKNNTSKANGFVRLFFENNDVFFFGLRLLAIFSMMQL